MNIDDGKIPKFDIRCKYNDCVMCYVRELASGKCKRCGWNPEVAQKRKAEVREARYCRMIQEGEEP